MFYETAEGRILSVVIQTWFNYISFPTMFSILQSIATLYQETEYNKILILLSYEILSGFDF